MAKDFLGWLSPRQRGLVVLSGSAACVLLNLAMLRSWNEYYTGLFPFAGAMAPVGAVLLVAGVTPDDVRKSRAIARVIVGLALVGLCAGLYANHLVST